MLRQQPTAEGIAMNEHDILARVRTLVDEEHSLRDRVQTGELAPEQEQAELRRHRGGPRPVLGPAASTPGPPGVPPEPRWRADASGA